MEWNKFVFPRPKPSYTENHPRLYWIPKKKEIKNTFSSKKETQIRKVPILFLQNSIQYKKLIIYFHGNAIDANLTLPLVDHIAESLQVK